MVHDMCIHAYTHTQINKLNYNKVFKEPKECMCCFSGEEECKGLGEERELTLHKQDAPLVINVVL